MHFNAFWHINTHHQILTSTEIRPIFSFPPTFLKFMHENRSPLFCQGSRLRPGVYGVDAPGQTDRSGKPIRQTGQPGRSDGPVRQTGCTNI